MKRRHIIQKITALLLALTLLLTACGPERPPVTISPTNPVVTTTAAQDVTEPSTDPAETTSADWRAEARGLSDEPEELPEWPYHSEALDFSPAEGIRIKAEAGALYDDTEITLTPVTEDDGRLLQLAEDFDTYGEPVIGIWEVHAGLEPDEHLPGTYTVSFDLAALDVDESLWPAVRLYRLADDDTLTAYSTKLEGGILSYTTSQNSITFATICEAILASISPAIPIYEIISQYGVDYLRQETEYGNFLIKWPVKDVDPKQQEKWEKMRTITAKHKAVAQKDYEKEAKDLEKAEIFIRIFRANKSVEKRTLEYLQKDEEFVKLVQSIKVPELIEAVSEAVRTAYEYLGGWCLTRMPGHEVTFYVKRMNEKNREPAYGYSVTPPIGESYIEINLDLIIELLEGGTKGTETKDNMLLTVTHELFHICQQEYHTRYGTDSDRFDEMTALLVEEEAKTWYTRHEIITTNPALTRTDYWSTLRLPIDAIPSYSSQVVDIAHPSQAVSSLVLRHQGYLLSDLVRYLREKTGEYVSGVHLYRCRSYYSTPVTSKPLMAAFKLSEVQFDKYFRQFCITHWKDFITGYVTEGEYNPYPELSLKKDEGVHVSLSTEGSYTAGVRCFYIYEPKALPLLMVVDENRAAEHPEAEIVCGEKSISTRNGAYMPGPEKYVGRSQNRRLFLEIYGKVGPNIGTESGYTVWALDEPDAPVLECADGSLTVKFPEPRGAAKAGLMDGLLLKVVSDDGKETEWKYSELYFGKSITIPLQELLNEGTDKATLTVSFAEFVYSKKNETCPGLYSKEVKIPVDYSVKGQAYRFNSDTLVMVPQVQVFPALRDALENSTLYLSEDGSFTVSGTGRAARTPENEQGTAEGFATASFTIKGQYDMKTGTGTATISGTVRDDEVYQEVWEREESASGTDSEGRPYKLTHIEKTYIEEKTNFIFTFSGTGQVSAVDANLHPGVDGLILTFATHWTRSGAWESWKWTVKDWFGSPDYEGHEETERKLVDEDRSKDPWDETLQFCWTIGEYKAILDPFPTSHGPMGY
ncbi:MAG: hypothetical protein J5493_03115 [Lachnospiraceae bacterium]|nr:hypothetical protein [Lachnospiraceae bacterium]